MQELKGPMTQRKNGGKVNTIKFIVGIPLSVPVNCITEIFFVMPSVKLQYNDNNIEFMAWGDPITNEGFIEGLAEEPDANYIMNNLYGHYYYILLNKNNGEIYIGNSLFSILPLYYYQNDDKIFFSENAIDLGEYSDLKKIIQKVYS